MWLKGVIAQAMDTMARRRPSKLAGGMPEGAVRIESLRMGDVASAVELVARVLRVDPGDRGEQFASDITDDLRQMFVAKANGQVVAYGGVAELAADEAAPGTPALGFQEMKRFGSERSVAGVDVLSRLARTAAYPNVRQFTDQE